MATGQAVLYLLAVILLFLAAIPVPPSVAYRYSLCCLAAASALLAFSLPTIAGGFH